MIKNRTCPKCNSAMAEGKYSGQQVKWLKEEDNTFLKESGNEITTYSCTKCGYLESYVGK